MASVKDSVLRLHSCKHIVSRIHTFLRKPLVSHTPGMHVEHLQLAFTKKMEKPKKEGRRVRLKSFQTVCVDSF